MEAIFDSSDSSERATSPHSAVADSRSTSTRRRWIGRTLSGLAVAFLLFDSAMKLAMVQPVIDASERMGFPADTARPIGVVPAGVHRDLSGRSDGRPRGRAVDRIPWRRGREPSAPRGPAPLAHPVPDLLRRSRLGRALPSRRAHSHHRPLEPLKALKGAGRLRDASVGRSRGSTICRSPSRRTLWRRARCWGAARRTPTRTRGARRRSTLNNGRRVVPPDREELLHRRDARHHRQVAPSADLGGHPAPIARHSDVRGFDVGDHAGRAY